MSKNRPVFESVTEQDGIKVFKPLPRCNREAMLAEALLKCQKENKPGVVLLGSDQVIDLRPEWKADVVPSLASRIDSGAYLSRDRHAAFSRAFAAGMAAD